ncbi:Seed maturation protein PM36 [Platanthera guangdongensis]|uniref:Seed maturation protein PM36 n=1 Tax=Platanthera guangdongensis TaxID=2320717 RepID=A0ABR2LFJ5_9ASPA
MSGDGGESGTTARWVEKHSPLYVQATRHPFICRIKDGSVNISAFRRWLAQDYLFVREFIPFIASLLLKASKESDVDVVLGGIAALNDEISWFRKEASKWGISLNVVPQMANLEYCRFLQSLALPDVNYSVAMTALWAIETVYHESFSFCLESGSKTPDELMEACRRWGNTDFGQYCCTLRKIADRCLETSSGDVVTQSEEIFIRVLNFENDFWNMSLSEL